MAGSTDVAVVGAGPYGLAATAFLRHQGTSTHTFGEAMGSWRHQMPRGMILRSKERASSIAHPVPGHTITAWARAHDVALDNPATLEHFLDYGDWIAERVVPDLDHRRVEQVVREGSGFSVNLDDGDRMHAERVVMAVGLRNMERSVPELEGLGEGAVSHVADHEDLSTFAGKRVLVLGLGQSALENAAILADLGVAVAVTARAKTVRWLGPHRPGTPTFRQKWRVPPTDVGGRATGWIAAAPETYRRLPERLQLEVRRRCLFPAGSHNLRARLEHVPFHLGRGILSAESTGGEIVVTLQDGSTLRVDHVMAGSGYDIDVARYDLLDKELLGELTLLDGFPQLGKGFESSVPGLHFVGAPAVRSFGPVNRFVTGTWYAGPELARRVAGKRGPTLRVAFPVGSHAIA
jgi:cation diffusion facilitator CzcD-associated flavoprotein CzcO